MPRDGGALNTKQFGYGLLREPEVVPSKQDVYRHFPVVGLVEDHLGRFSRLLGHGPFGFGATGHRLISCRLGHGGTFGKSTTRSGQSSCPDSQHCRMAFPGRSDSSAYRASKLSPRMRRFVEKVLGIQAALRVIRPLRTRLTGSPWQRRILRHNPRLQSWPDVVPVPGQFEFALVTHPRLTGLLAWYSIVDQKYANEGE